VALVLSLVLTVILTLKLPVITPARENLYHAVHRYAAAGADLSDLLRSRPVPVDPRNPWLWEVCCRSRGCARCLRIGAEQRGVHYAAVLRRGAGDPAGQWQSCEALGMSKAQTLRILLPYAFKRALSSYSNEVVLVFKSTSLAYTITLMEVMGHSQLMYGRTYDVMVFGAAGLVYLCVNGLLTLMMRVVERRALAFERRN
jgi:arginine transport system permease protein